MIGFISRRLVLPCIIALSVSPAQAADIIAIGDLHGDLPATIRVLRMADVIDDNHRWSGADNILVQMGDRIDRGEDDRAVMDLFELLAREAALSGGAVYPILGNHEIYNVNLDFREITTNSYAAFNNLLPPDGGDTLILSFPDYQRGRVSAFRPGGHYARIIGSHPPIIQAGDSVFVHGGILPEWAGYGIIRINTEMQAWLNGTTPPPEYLLKKKNPFFDRTFAKASGIDQKAEACIELGKSLGLLNAKRMVVGHTPQLEGISSACEGRVWQIDTGISAYFGGKTQALKITPSGTVTIIQ